MTKIKNSCGNGSGSCSKFRELPELKVNLNRRNRRKRQPRSKKTVKA